MSHSTWKGLGKQGGFKGEQPSALRRSRASFPSRGCFLKCIVTTKARKTDLEYARQQRSSGGTDAAENNRNSLVRAWLLVTGAALSRENKRNPEHRRCQPGHPSGARRGEENFVWLITPNCERQAKGRHLAKAPLGFPT